MDSRSDPCLIKTLDWSFETLDRECNSSGLCIHFNNTRVASENDSAVAVKTPERTKLNFFRYSCTISGSCFLQVFQIDVPCLFLVPTALMHVWVGHRAIFCKN